MSNVQLLTTNHCFEMIFIWKGSNETD